MAIPPSLPFVVVADGPVLRGYDTTLKPLWDLVPDSLSSPRFHGVAVGGSGASFVIYAALEVNGPGGGTLKVLRFDGTMPAAGKGKMLIAPNVVERSSGRPYVFFRLIGNPGGSVSIRIFDVAGHLVTTIPAPLDGAGRAEVKWDVGTKSSTTILPGTYWALADGGGVSDKKALAVVDKR
jgi:hypothetical protein